MPSGRKRPTLQELPASDRLRVNDLLFVNAYMANGRNATRAYQSVHPKAKYTSAAVEAYRVLNKPSVQAEIAKRVQVDVGITKAGIERDLLTYKSWAEHAKDYEAAASIAMDAAKLAGFLVEKREVKTVSDEQRSAIRELVARTMAYNVDSVKLQTPPNTHADS